MLFICPSLLCDCRETKRNLICARDANEETTLLRRCHDLKFKVRNFCDSKYTNQKFSSSFWTFSTADYLKLFSWFQLHQTLAIRELVIKPNTKFGESFWFELVLKTCNFWNYALSLCETFFFSNFRAQHSENLWWYANINWVVFPLRRLHWL